MPYSGPLDIVSSDVIVAYGNRAMGSGYLGSPLYDLGRTQDSTIETFNCDNTSGDAPTTSIGTFTAALGGGTAVLGTWYDQSGNGEDLLTGPNTPDFPQDGPYWNIVAASAKPGIGGFYIASMATAGWWDETGGISTSEGDSFTAMGVVYVDEADYGGGYWMWLGDPNSAAYLGSLVWSGNEAGPGAFLDVEMQNEDTSDYTEGDVDSPPSSGLHIFEFTIDGSGNQAFWVDGVSQTLDASAFNANSPFAMVAMSAGVRIYTPADYGNGACSSYYYELALWKAVLSSGDRTSIRENMASYYGITLP